MRLALAQARSPARAGEVPIGAVVVQSTAVPWRRRSTSRSAPATPPPTPRSWPCARRRRRWGTTACPGTTVYVTLEPCLMCVGALVNARVAAVVYGAAEPKWGALASVLDVRTLRLNHRFEVVAGVLEAECRELLVDFFSSGAAAA